METKNPNKRGNKMQIKGYNKKIEITRSNASKYDEIMDQVTWIKSPLKHDLSGYVEYDYIKGNLYYCDEIKNAHEIYNTIMNNQQDCALMFDQEKLQFIVWHGAKNTIINDMLFEDAALYIMEKMMDKWQNYFNVENKSSIDSEIKINLNLLRKRLNNK